jgi:hypothetical protein
MIDIEYIKKRVIHELRNDQEFRQRFVEEIKHELKK